MIKYPETLKQAAELIKKSKNIVIACHERPDGDAAGSMLGLANAIESTGRQVSCCCADPVNGNLSFLPGAESVQHGLPEKLPSGTTLVIVDCNEATRLGVLGPQLVKQASSVLVIDHHMGEGLCLEGDAPDSCCQYIDTEMSAAACVCLLLITELDIPVSKDTATCLYTAIVTDTGSFRHSNTTGITFEMAGMLVDAGADPGEIALRLYQHKAPGSIHLLKLILQTFALEAKNNIGIIHVTPEMFLQSGATESDMDDYIHYPRSVSTVEAAVFVKELRKGQVSVSLRSKRTINVEAIAREYGGGGHFHAAGFRQKGSAEDVRDMIVKRLNREFEKV